MTPSIVASGTRSESESTIERLPSASTILSLSTGIISRFGLVPRRPVEYLLSNLIFLIGEFILSAASSKLRSSLSIFQQYIVHLYIVRRNTDYLSGRGTQ